jgi:phage/conjugal plasmid C-4 type zinc finger TraR family protein
MADEIDRAEALIERTRAYGIAAACAAAMALSKPSEATHCEACGDPIPAGRRVAIPAARHCVRCASEGRP